MLEHIFKAWFGIFPCIGEFYEVFSERPAGSRPGEKNKNVWMPTTKKMIPTVSFRYVLVSLSVCIIVFSASAQDSSGYKHRYIGLGVRSSVFQVSEISFNLIPSNRIILNADILRYLRIEGQFASYTDKQDKKIPAGTTGDYTPLTLKKSSTIVGFGGFGMYPRDNVKFYGGVRIADNSYSEDDAYTSGISPYAVTSHGDIRIIASVAGAEYCFNKWFSIGAEFSLVNLKNSFYPWDKSIPSSSTTTNITESGLVFRFYPL